MCRDTYVHGAVRGLSECHAHASSDSVRDMPVGNMLSRAASDSLALDLTGWLAETSQLDRLAHVQQGHI